MIKNDLDDIPNKYSIKPEMLKWVDYAKWDQNNCLNGKADQDHLPQRD